MFSTIIELLKKYLDLLIKFIAQVTDGEVDFSEAVADAEDFINKAKED